MGISDSEAIEIALNDIRNFLAEESVIAITYRDAKWVGSTMQDAGDVVTVAPGATTNVYSWKGTHDRAL
jgi:hypothetical protein